ncbi:type IV pilus modification PilV family protein [Blastopirellula retiformator]|nr:prepilin-type N-terminal cleavage/methylation domain-containing protein [Blastopirellula retiformator]
MHRLSSRAPNRTSRGFSLIEVVLAFAILAGSLAVLGQLISIGFRSAREAEGLTESQMLCQTIMDEIIVGVRLPDPVSDIPIDMLTDSSVVIPNRTADWVYSIDSQPSAMEGLLAVQVIVRRANATSLANADQFELIRWIPDPEADLLEMPDSSDPNSTTSSSSGGAI